MVYSSFFVAHAAAPKKESPTSAASIKKEADLSEAKANRAIDAYNAVMEFENVAGWNGAHACIESCITLLHQNAGKVAITAQNILYLDDLCATAHSLNIDLTVPDPQTKRTLLKYLNDQNDTHNNRFARSFSSQWKSIIKSLGEKPATSPSAAAK